MNKAQHTAGPWRVAGRVNPAGGCYQIVSDEPGEYDFTGRFCTTLSDARLIAAAPDLLDACEKALAGLSAWVDDYPYGVPQEDRDLLNQLRAAIVKARGEEAGL